LRVLAHQWKRQRGVAEVLLILFQPLHRGAGHWGPPRIFCCSALIACRMMNVNDTLPWSFVSAFRSHATIFTSSGESRIELGF
jgi:hypothetical protein